MKTMEDDVRSTADRDVKKESTENGRSVSEAKPSYKSWKKKYIKMRHTFDQKREDLEKMRAQELQARKTVKRIAIENDRILDLLRLINNSPQIPPEKRVDVSLSHPPTADSDAEDEKDTKHRARVVPPAKSLENLLVEVPHRTYQQAKEQLSELVDHMEAFDSEAWPSNVLSPDDIDDYLWEVDRRMAVPSEQQVPTLAPVARRYASTAADLAAENPSVLDPNPAPHIIAAVLSRNPAPPAPWDVAIKNLTGGYTWLRKYAPKTFLQDAETSRDNGHHAQHHDDDGEGETHRTGRRGTRGGARGERGGRAGAGSARSKRVSAAHRAAAAQDGWDASMDDDPDYSAVTPATGRGKRKRVTGDDEDRGYRPKGGSSSRPTKKKRRSDGDVSTPTTGGPKRAKKEKVVHDD